tara:strand:+ start:1767 stop:2093 length:327 start_codon:yes stop_codon:yes gene_type:complete
MEYDQALKEYQEAIQKADEAEKLLKSTADGYKYVVEIHSYGSSWTEYFINEYTADKIYSHYNGENGMSFVFTTNPNNTFYDDSHDEKSPAVTILSEADWLIKFNINLK